LSRERNLYWYHGKKKKTDHGTSRELPGLLENVSTLLPKDKIRRKEKGTKGDGREKL